MEGRTRPLGSIGLRIDRVGVEPKASRLGIETHGLFQFLFVATFFVFYQSGLDLRTWAGRRRKACDR